MTELCPTLSRCQDDDAVTALKLELADRRADSRRSMLRPGRTARGPVWRSPCRRCAGACASSGARSPAVSGARRAAGPGPGDQPSGRCPARPRSSKSPTPSSRRLRAGRDRARRCAGVPYRNGGATPEGFDCSGFTQYVYAQHGVALPREVREQFRTGKAVKPEESWPGDLLFFTTIGPGADACGDRALAATSSFTPPARPASSASSASARSYWCRALPRRARQDSRGSELPLRTRRRDTSPGELPDVEIVLGVLRRLLRRRASARSRTPAASDSHGSCVGQPLDVALRKRRERTEARADHAAMPRSRASSKSWRRKS